jgi:GIY-YIG catalytic domain/NUMOD3 motif
MFIYVIVNSETLKIYVGQHKGNSLTRYLQQKLSEARHGISGQSRLYAAMRKYPRESWSICPLITDLRTREECDHWEQVLIKALKTQHPDVGYNICPGGQGFTGPHTEETRDKIRRHATTSFRKGHAVSQEVRQKISQAHKGKKESAESSQKKRKSLAAWYQKHEQPNKGRFTKLTCSSAQEVIDAYLLGESTESLGKKFGASGAAIRSLFKLQRVPLRSRADAARLAYVTGRKTVYRGEGLC